MQNDDCKYGIRFAQESMLRMIEAQLRSLLQSVSYDLHCKYWCRE